MIGIKAIASYVPAKRISNYAKKDKFELTDEFIKDKIGVEEVSVKELSEESSTLCVKAFKNLKKNIDVDVKSIDALIVVTQNPDFNIPHTSAMVHGMLGVQDKCAAFDISLGCSGFVYALSVIKSFMEANNMRRGLLFTADPYSKIIDPDDKNTSLLFGDGAAVTYLTDQPSHTPTHFTFGTTGKQYKDLLCSDRILFMNGRAIYSFASKTIPDDVATLLENSALEPDDIDRFIFHQGSKFIVDTLIKRIGLDPGKVAYDIHGYGNTVSSSIPILLEQEMENPANKTFLVSGFGVGLSWSSAILKRNE